MMETDGGFLVLRLRKKLGGTRLWTEQDDDKVEAASLQAADPLRVKLEAELFKVSDGVNKEEDETFAMYKESMSQAFSTLGEMVQQQRMTLKEYELLGTNEMVEKTESGLVRIV